MRIFMHEKIEKYAIIIENMHENMHKNRVRLITRMKQFEGFEGIKIN